MEYPRETGEWLVQLRARFLALSLRRVPESVAEDLVQDALSIVLEKGVQLGEDVDGRPALAWCFQVLRNTIGNFYQKQRTRSGHSDIDDALDLAGGDTPLEAMETSEVSQLLHETIAGLDTDDDRCGRYLRRLGEGYSPAEMAVEEGLDAAILYRRIYRCRAKLRTLLRQKGVLP